ncbi:MAG: hypothetical protein M3429_09600 [Verrucomicrobiota bacterium]|nr:hypothetical protein [Verrucomicrobiota bacterium]
MKVYERKGRVSGDGTLSVEAPAELADQEVEILITKKRAPAGERLAAWRRLFQRLEAIPRVREISDEDIQAEIDGARGAR